MTLVVVGKTNIEPAGKNPSLVLTRRMEEEEENHLSMCVVIVVLFVHSQSVMSSLLIHFCGTGARGDGMGRSNNKSRNGGQPREAEMTARAGKGGRRGRTTIGQVGGRVHKTSGRAAPSLLLLRSR